MDYHIIHVRITISLLRFVVMTHANFPYTTTCNMFWFWQAVHNAYTVETLYSTIYYSKYFIELNFDKSTQYVALWTHNMLPFRASYGVSFVSISTEIDRVIKGFYCSVHENHRTCRTFPMARRKCPMRDFTNLNRIHKAHRTNVWWIMKVFRVHCYCTEGVMSWLHFFASHSIPGPRLNIKTVLSTYDDFHVKDKTAVRTSYL